MSTKTYRNTVWRTRRYDEYCTVNQGVDATASDERQIIAARRERASIYIADKEEAPRTRQRVGK